MILFTSTSAVVYGVNTPDNDITESVDTDTSRFTSDLSYEIISASEQRNDSNNTSYNEIDLNSYSSETYSELIGFVVRGRHLYERLQIDDLDALIGPDEQRWIPLLRILILAAWLLFWGPGFLIPP